MRIHAEQVHAFERAAWNRFEQELVEHSKEFSPVLCGVLGDEQVLVAVRAAMRRAWQYGFTNRGPIRLFLELTFLCGSGFDTDPQYAFAAKALRGEDDQMVRAERLHAGHNVYLEEVSGAHAINVRNALRRLSSFAREPVPFDRRSFDAGIRAELQRAFPEKARYVGDPALTMLLEEAKQTAAAHAFVEARQVTLLAVLMFAFGHACTNDPLYPWIAGTLQDSRIVSAAGRAERLERKAVTWLTHVLANETSRAAA